MNSWRDGGGGTKTEGVEGSTAEDIDAEEDEDASDGVGMIEGEEER